MYTVIIIVFMLIIYTTFYIVLRESDHYNIKVLNKISSIYYIHY
jgi:hypothetical protein